MTKLIKTVLSLIVCFVFVGALGTVPKAQASPAIPPQPQQTFSNNGQLISAKPTDDQVAFSMTHWTLATRQAAKGFGLTNIGQSDFNAMDNYAAAGAPGSKPGGIGDPAALEKAKSEYPDAWAALSDRQSLSLPTLQAPSLLTPYGTKNTFDGYYGSYYDEMWLHYPYYTVGRLYFTDGSYDYWCTASLISPNNIIVTAAHCVYDTDYNYYYYGWIFVPADYGGVAPLGYYSADNYLFWAKWASAKKSSQALNLDLALLHLAPNSFGYASQNGWMGYAYNQNPKSLDHTIGYATNKYSGISTYICVAEGFQKKADVLGMGCDMTYGSSGAPWILGYQPYYSGWVNAVVSSGTPGIPTFYGPRFSSKNFTPMCAYWGC